MAAIRELAAQKANRFDLVAIPRDDKTEKLIEKDALVLARMNCTGVDWEGGMKLSAFNSDLRCSMERNVGEFDDGEMVNAGVENPPKQILAVRESVWSKDGDKAWQGVKQAPCKVNLSPNKYRVKDKDHEGWWVVDPKNRPLPMAEANYALFIQAVENVMTAAGDLSIDKAGGMLMLKPFKPNHAKFHEFVGKCVRWELRESDNA